MAECTSGDLVVLVMSPEESELVVLALLELWKNGGKVVRTYSDYESGTLLSLMDSIGIQ